MKIYVIKETDLVTMLCNAESVLNADMRRSICSGIPFNQALISICAAGTTHVFLSEIRNMYEEAGKIRAIKLARDLLSIGLREAKMLVEEQAIEYGWKAYQPS